MTTLINKESTQHYANKMVLAENRKVGSKSLPTALNEIDALIDEMKTYFDAEYGSALDMKLENNKNIFSVGTGTNIDKRSEVENSFTDVELSGNSLVNLFTTTQNFVAAGNNIARNGFVITLSNTSGWAKIGNRLSLKPNTTYYAQITCENKSNTVCGSYIRFSHDINYSTGTNIPQFPANSTTTQSKVFTTDDTGLVLLSVERGQGTNESIFYDIILLEGDWTNKPIPQYFQGLKSVGEKEDGNHKFSIASFNNGNVIVNPTYKTGFYVSLSSGVEQVNNDYSCTDFIRIESNKKIRVINTNFNIAFYNKDKKNIPIKVQDLSGINTDFTTITPKESYYVRFSTHNNAIGTEGCFYGDNIGDINKEIRIDKKEISLNEPLRGLPSGIKDTIEKINGEWKIVRRCGEVVLDGSEDWLPPYDGSVTNGTTKLFEKKGLFNPLDNNNVNTIADRFPSYDANYVWHNNVEGISLNVKGSLHLRLKIDRLSEVTSSGLKTWLTQNPIKCIYKLVTPIIEDISPITLQCWKNGTISINEVLPVETTHTVALNKSAQIKNNIKELTTLRKRVEDLESFYDKIALEQAYQLDLVNHSYELDYNR